MKERDVRGCEREKECVCVCVTEGAIVPERHSRAIFHLARQPRTAISATAAGLNLRGRMDKDTERRRWTDETCLNKKALRKRQRRKKDGRVF